MSQDSGYYDTDVDFWLAKAMEDIKDNYRHTVSVALKSKDLIKFGRNPLIQTSKTTVMDLPSGVQNETYVSTNAIDTISSSSGSDTRTVKIEGHTISGTDLTFSVQTATLDGQNKVVLSTPLARCTRIYADDSSDVELVGNIYVYEDDTVVAGVPQTGSKVHAMIPAGVQQTRKASTSISSTDYWIIFDFDCDMYKKTAGFAEVTLEIRREGGVFRPVETLAVSSGTHSDHKMKPYLIVPPNSDVRLVAIASAADTDLGGSIQGVLAKIV